MADVVRSREHPVGDHRDLHTPVQLASTRSGSAEGLVALREPPTSSPGRLSAAKPTHARRKGLTNEATSIACSCRPSPLPRRAGARRPRRAPAGAGRPRRVARRPAGNHRPGRGPAVAVVLAVRPLPTGCRGMLSANIPAASPLTVTSGSVAGDGLGCGLRRTKGRPVRSRTRANSASVRNPGAASLDVQLHGGHDADPAQIGQSAARPGR